MNYYIHFNINGEFSFKYCTISIQHQINKLRYN